MFDLTSECSFIQNFDDSIYSPILVVKYKNLLIDHAKVSLNFDLCVASTVISFRFVRQYEDLIIICFFLFALEAENY